MNLSAQVPFFSRVSYVDKLLFTKHVAIMLKSGITLEESLAIFAEQSQSSSLKKTVLGVLQSVENGQTFAQALKKYPHVFDTFYVSIIEVGESSGTLDESLHYLSVQLTKEYIFRKKIQGVLLYPAIVFSSAITVGIGISIFVLPKLLDLFKGFDVELPLPTRILIGFSEIMQQYGLLIFTALIGSIIAFRFLIALSVIQPWWERFLFSLPFFGSILQNAQLSSLTRNLGILLKSGVPIMQALTIEARMTSNMIFKTYIKHMLAAIDSGKSLSKELESKKYTNIPLIATKMIAVGETTGKLDETLMYLGDFFEEELDEQTKNISTVLEPVILLCIGLLVAFVALSIISPIYELTGSIKR